MSMLGLLLATAILLAPAWAWLERLVPEGTPCRRLLIAGYCIPIGILLTTLAMRVLSLFSIEHSLTSIGAVATALLLVGLFAPRKMQVHSGPHITNHTVSGSNIAKLVMVLCLTLIAARLIMLGVELSTRPVFAWDTKQHWGKQAKVFFEYRSVIPYVSLQEWLELQSPNVFTNVHPDYPISIPLLQSFTAIAIGGWNGSLINIFWLLIWVGIGLTVFSQSVIAGAHTATALAGTFLILSMPYLNVHVALAGYADLLQASCFLGAFTAFYNWSHSRSRWMLTLALLCAFGGLLVKNEGLFWLLALVPGLLLVQLGNLRGMIVIAVLGSIGLMALLVIPGDLPIAGHTLNQLDLGYRPQSWRPIYLSLLVHDNWHLAFHIFLISLLALPLLGGKEVPALAVAVTVLLLFTALYVLTSNAVGAIHLTSINRVGLHFMPALGFFSLVIVAKLCNRQEAAIDPHSGNQSPSSA